MDSLTNELTTSCCICGGGPAGMMLGFLLARAGVDVIVLEKHQDFLRDFRGDTIHPSTLQLMHELSLLDDFLKLPHQEVKELSGQFNDISFKIADFSHLPLAKPMLVLMPQWDFLNFIALQAKRYTGFHLYTETTVTHLIKNNERVAGIKATTPQGILTVNADIIIGTDGRRSTVREQAALHITATGVPIDVLWFRLSRNENGPAETFGRFNKGRMMVLLQRGAYWQCPYVIAKGDFENIRANSIENFQKEVAAASPFLSSRVNELKEWEQVKLLSVAIDHLDKWYCDGLLCIGDAAHAMSPVGGVGINLAIQDAVATANILYKPLLEGKKITTSLLKKIQQRRSFPARMIQRLQVFVQKGIITQKQNNEQQPKLPFLLNLVKTFPILRRIPARVIGMGIRPEHIKTPSSL